MQTQEFKGIWLPKEICDLQNLTWTEKIMLSEIAMLSNPNNCYANNEHFSKILKITKESVSRIISKLTKEGYLVSQLKYKQNTKQVEQRILKINWNIIPNTIDNTSPQMCNSPPHKYDNDLPTETLKIEYNRENNIENIYAQNCVPKENLKRSENIQQRFERFYKAYPKKKSRGNALKWFQTHKPPSELVDTMIESLNQQKSTLDWQKENGRYIPYPATWLNARGWENEINQQEIVDLSENSVSRILAIELYETLKNVQFTRAPDTQKLIKAWTIEIEKYLSVERTRDREDRIFYAINGIKNSDKWRKIIVDAKSFIKNINFIS